MIERELSPRSVARLLEPEWRFDAPAIAEWSLFDVYALGRDRVVVELADGARSLRVALAPDADGLSIRWMQPGPADAGSAACRALSALITTKAGPARWIVREDAALDRPEAFALHVSEARVDDDPDRAILALDVARYARLYGASPRAVRLSDAGLSLFYPAPRNGAQPPSGRLYAVPQRFHRRRFREYFARLGCSYDDGVPRTVPTPATFARAVERAPLLPRVILGWRGAISPARWARALVRHRALLVAVAPRWAVELHRQIRRVPQLATIPVDVGMLAHDVSLHALGLHAMDPEQWRALLARARERLDASPRSAARLAAFFEGPLTRTAWEVWGELERPEDFAAELARRAEPLEAALTTS